MRTCYIFWFAFLISTFSFGQGDGRIFYQTVVRDLNGNSIANQQLMLRVSFRSTNQSPVLYWQEDHNLSTDNFGRLQTVLGTGLSTGNGTVNSFQLIPWVDTEIHVHFEIDTGNVGSFNYLGYSSIFSQPYSLFADTTLSLFPLPLIGSLSGNSLNSPSQFQILAYDGNQFFSTIDYRPDTVQYSFFSDFSNTSLMSHFVINHYIDSVQFAFNVDTSHFSTHSSFANSSFLSTYSDTSLYAGNPIPNRWNLNGNSNLDQSFLGDNDSVKISIRVNNIERLAVHPDGSYTQGNIQPLGGYVLNSNNGILLQGSIGLGLHPNGTGSRLVWSPTRSSFRAGSADFSTWDSLSTGLYSMAFGLDNKAGMYSFASGFENDASGDNAMSFGYKNKSLAFGTAGAGTSFTMGDSCIATGIRSICIGRHSRTGSTSAVAFGNNSLALGNVSTSIGNDLNVQGNFSTAIGNFTSSGTRSGGLAWGDRSTTSLLQPAANNMFILRADGGIVFYTDPSNTMGVTLFSGSGSWASISDSSLKENIISCDPQDILRLTRKVEVYYWTYTSQENILHIGPMAQDIFSTFRLGDSDTRITNSDFDGLLLLCIKGLYDRITLFEQEMNQEEMLEQVDVLGQLQANQEARIKLIMDKMNLNH